MPGLQAIAETLAAQVRRSVAIDNLDGRLLAHTAHEEPVDQFRIDSVMLRRPKAKRTVTGYAQQFGIADATGPVRIPANDELGSLARVCVPIRCHQTLLGYLWLFDQPAPLTDAQLEHAARAATTAGEILFREQLLDDLRRGTERELLRDIVNPADEVRRHAASRLVAEHDIEPAARVLAMVVAIDEAADAVGIELALQHAGRRLSPTRSLGMATSATGGLLLIADPALPSRESLRAEAERIHAELATGSLDSSVRIGVGTARDSLLESIDSYRSAQEAARVARLLPSPGPVTFADELGVYGLLARLPLDSLEPDPLPPGLRQLIERDRSGALVPTLEAYLDSGCDPAQTASRLLIHRTTLYYRLSRITDLTGLNLRDGNDRLTLHLGLKLRHLMNR
ncbi:CdaR family transcriptional regulator [Amycolatopsis sp. GM8]|uniref:PucR family transcriptional regulator n=1 Tax=Amycolatopsis sp. GM8 TaxID=2896530 RepID=UPI001F281B0C|nr:helix-turn-helix domain-containing protein [Amycolatopsis sp. GM8]